MSCKFFNYVIIIIISIVIFTSCNLENGYVNNKDEITSLVTSTKKCYKNPQDNVEIVTMVLHGLKNEKLGPVIQHFAHNVEWTFDGNENEIPFAGTYWGKRNVKKALKEFYRMVNIEDLVIENQVEREETITSYTRLHGSIPSTTKTFDMEYVFALEFNSKHKIINTTVTYCLTSLKLAFSSSGKGHIVSNTSVSEVGQFYYDYFLSLKEYFRNATYIEQRGAFAEFPISSLPTDAEIEELSINSVEGEIVRVPGSIDDKIILYIHGGGFCGGNFKGWRLFTYTMAKYTSIPVLSINYRLAPENPFPAGAEDCLLVYEELLNTYDAKDIAIIGESSGGNLVMTTVLLARDENLPLPGAVIPLSPWLDMTNSAQSLIINDSTDGMVSIEGQDRNRGYYLGGTPYLYTDPFVSPLFAEVENFPPVYLTVSSCEGLLDDSINMFTKLSIKGIDVTIEIGDGMVHSYPVGSGLVPGIPESIATNIRLANFIMEKLDV